MKYSATKLLVAATLAGVLSGCTTTPPRAPETGLQMQAYQAREFTISKRVAFSATMSVFQDLGFIIDDGDFETGLITATGPTVDTKSAVPGWLSVLFSGQGLPISQHRRATAFVETMPSGATRVRLNFVFATQQGPNSATFIIESIHEPEMYQKTFADIDKAIFVRTQST